MCDEGHKWSMMDNNPLLYVTDASRVYEDILKKYPGLENDDSSSSSSSEEEEEEEKTVTPIAKKMPRSMRPDEPRLGKSPAILKHIRSDETKSAVLGFLRDNKNVLIKESELRTISNAYEKELFRFRLEQLKNPMPPVLEVFYVDCNTPMAPMDEEGYNILSRIIPTENILFPLMCGDIMIQCGIVDHKRVFLIKNKEGKITSSIVLKIY